MNKVTLFGDVEALEATGYARGTIAPVGSTSACLVDVDARLSGRRVAVGAGDHGFTAFGACAATVADVADLAEPAG